MPEYTGDVPVGTGDGAADFTLGVEEEFLLVDPETRRLVPRAAGVVPAAQVAAGSGHNVEHELQRSQIETGTGICHSLEDLRTELVGLRRAAADAADQSGCRIASAGTHPLTPDGDDQVTPKQAYLRLEQDYQIVMREQIVCGCHVHVGVADAEVAVQVLNRVRAWLPVVAALAVNSPFWMGEDTGYASFRTEIWRRWPTSGSPEPFASRSAYDALVDELRRTAAIDDPARIYWDVRPSARYDTLEFRMADACLTVDETVMVAAIVQGLVRTLHSQVLAGDRPVYPRPELLRAATWRAARYGTEGDLIDLEHLESVPAAELVARLLAVIRPALEETGGWNDTVALVNRTLANGTGAVRQRRAFARAGRLADVVDLVVTETSSG
ncbi:MAG: glutamate--cysteine ligase [Acidimicrobiia bacterium]|nr:glutamate--cysteine ligase [Acidimicrobiia bacterium]